MEEKCQYMQPPEYSEYTVNVETGTGRQLKLLFYKDNCNDFPSVKWLWTNMLASVVKHGFEPREMRHAWQHTSSLQKILHQDINTEQPNCRHNS